MSVFLQPIYTQTASGSANAITFNNIPQTFTDIKIVISARSTYSSAAQDYLTCWYNGDRSNIYTDTQIYSNGTTPVSNRDNSTNAINIGVYPAATSTSNTYCNIDFYMPNYTGSNYKSAISDYVHENNSATVFYNGLWATLYRSTNAITSITFYAGNGNFTSASTFSLYGILRQGI